MGDFFFGLVVGVIAGPFAWEGLKYLYGKVKSKTTK